MANDLEKKIIKQLEYYFGDINLPRDNFLQGKLKEDDGWVTLDCLLTFQRLADLTKDQELIANAIEKSENKLIIVSEDRKKLKRSPDKPLPELNDERKNELAERTAYVKGFAKTETLDEIMAFLEPHGPIESCIRRTYLDKIAKEQVFKGSCFVIFKDLETCKKFIEAESIKHNDVELIRKFKNVYFEDKKKEYSDRKNKKGKKEEKKVEQPETKKDKPVIPGSVIHFSLNEDPSVTREKIKEKVQEITKDLEISFVEFSMGKTEGHLQFSTENSASVFYKLLEDGKMKVGDAEFTFKEIDAAEEEAYGKRINEELKERRKNYNHNGKFNSRKRKGNFRNQGPRSKK